MWEIKGICLYGSSGIQNTRNLAGINAGNISGIMSDMSGIKGIFLFGSCCTQATGKLARINVGHVHFSSPANIIYPFNMAAVALWVIGILFHYMCGTQIMQVTPK